MTYNVSMGTLNPTIPYLTCDIYDNDTDVEDSNILCTQQLFKVSFPGEPGYCCNINTVYTCQE